MSYLVMECHASYAVLLDEEGRLVKAANLHYQIGQTVEAPVIMREPEAAKVSRLPRKLGATVAAAACMMLLLLGYYQNYMAPYTAIALSINPSVLMELNRQGDVVDLEGLNDDGEDLLEGYRPASKDRLEVTDALIDRAIAMGYLSAGGYISIDIDTPDDARFQQYGVELRSNVTEYLAERFTVTVEIKRHKAPTASEDDDDTDDLVKPTVLPAKADDDIAGDDGAEDKPGVDDADDVDDAADDDDEKGSASLYSVDADDDADDDADSADDTEESDNDSGDTDSDSEKYDDDMDDENDSEDAENTDDDSDAAEAEEAEEQSGEEDDG